MTSFLRYIGSKLSDIFKSSDKDEESVSKYISSNNNGKMYIDDIEGYLEAGNCFEEMEQMSELINNDE